MSIDKIEHPSWQILDSTKIQTYMECPRKFFYNYIMAIRRRGSDLHLEFGRALHKSLEYFNEQRKNNPNFIIEDADIAIAHREFLKVYRETQPKEFDDDHKPKDPKTAMDALVSYTMEYNERDASEEVINSETAGCVAIAPDRLLWFKMDATLRNNMGIFVRDYKTSQMMGNSWSIQWNQKFQTLMYLYATMCMYENVWGLEVRGIFLYKTEQKSRMYGNIDFMDFPIRKSMDMIQEFLWTANQWFDSIMYEMDELHKAKEDALVMTAFPKNPESCNKWGGCPYLDLCNSWTNPLQKLDRIPSGFEVYYWDPRNVESKNKVELK